MQRSAAWQWQAWRCQGRSPLASSGSDEKIGPGRLVDEMQLTVENVDQEPTVLVDPA